MTLSHAQQGGHSTTAVPARVIARGAAWLRWGQRAFTALLAVVLCGPLMGCFKQEAPQVTYKTITGEAIGPTSYRGQVLLVNFWATSCSTCVKEMPMLASTHEKFKAQGYRTIAVAMSYDRPDYVLNFATSRALPFDVALDLDGSIAKAFNDVKVTPTTVLINRKGEIVKTWVGEPEEQSFHALIEKALKESA